MPRMQLFDPSTDWLIINNASHVLRNSHPEIGGPRMLDVFARHATTEGGAS